jgi:dTDP-4-dehydrorhamnose reductase
MRLRYVVTGSRGQLGRCLVRRLTGSGEGSGEEGGEGPVAEFAAECGAECVHAFNHSDLDIADSDAVARALDGLPGGPPDVLVNAAAYNQVDACEDEGAADAIRINGEAPGGLARVCKAVGTRLVHVSTDYVFPGDAVELIPEDADPAPRTAYGRSKLQGERAVLDASGRALVVRTSWVFGPGRNFVGAILRQARLRRSGEVQGPLRVVDDQRGFPTYAADLADGILALVAAVGEGPGSVYHLCNGPTPDDAEAISWWDFARTILDERDYRDLEIQRISTSDSGARAPRPAYSVMGCEKAAALGVRLRSWREALGAYLASPDLATTLELQDPQT